MQGYLIRLLTIISILCLSITSMAAIPNTNNARTFLGPTIKGSVVVPVNETFAYNLLGEAGVRNFRANGTVGWALQPNQRIKVGAEFLLQQITYSFFSGDTNQWVNQAAIGADYQYDFAAAQYVPQLNINAFYSHAPNKSLSTVTGTFMPGGIASTFVNMRRIAGSNAYGIAPGVNIHPWQGGEVGVDVNYDHVRYDKKFGPDREAKGLGGTAHVRQLLANGFGLNASAAVRQPFNNYQAELTWTTLAATGLVNLGVGGAYTVGKKTLPNTYNILVNASYMLDSLGSVNPRRMARDFMTGGSISQFVSKPAVYLPQVLAIPDESVTTSPVPIPIPGCAAGVPTVTGILPDLIDVTDPTVVATAGVFTGSALTFSVTTTPAPAPTTVTIDPTSGIITITPVPSGEDETFTTTVTATNVCGSASTSFAFTVPAD